MKRKKKKNNNNRKNMRKKDYKWNKIKQNTCIVQASGFGFSCDI